MSTTSNEVESLIFESHIPSIEKERIRDEKKEQEKENPTTSEIQLQKYEIFFFFSFFKHPFLF